MRSQWGEGMRNLFERLDKHRIGASEKIKEIVDRVSRHTPPSFPVIEEMTFRDAVGYFVENRPSEPAVAKGAMLLQPDEEGRLFIQVFLTKTGELVTDHAGRPYCRVARIYRMDDELMNVFKGQDLVVVE